METFKFLTSINAIYDFYEFNADFNSIYNILIFVNDENSTEPIIKIKYKNIYFNINLQPQNGIKEGEFILNKNNFNENFYLIELFYKHENIFKELIFNKIYDILEFDSEPQRYELIY